jgi:fatty acid desaturase
VWMCVIKQILWWPSLVRYIHIRARYSVTGEGDGPYLSPPPQSQLLLRIGVLFLAGLVVVLTLLVQADKPWLLGVIPVGMLAAIVGFYMVVPERFFRGTLIAPIVPLRWLAIMRIGFLSILFVALAWLTYLTGKPWGLYYVVLWIVPLLTMFPFFMILRQVVQHGNAGNDRLGNTRIFFVGRLIQLAVFPIGMDYHLPHHLFPMVPHFRLQALHALLLNTAAYRRQATVVEGYFFHRGVRASGLTVLDLMARERI